LMSIASSSLVSGVSVFAAAELRGIGGPPELNDRGCREHTSRVSTPALRNKAQKSWAPKSLEPHKVFAAALKSAFSMDDSASMGISNYLRSTFELNTME
jgi:hypothetical protein